MEKLTKVDQLKKEIMENLNFSKIFAAGIDEIIPVAVQDFRSREILMVGHVDPEGVALTLINRVATFWSISRNRRWVKGESSGNFLDIVDVLLDCESSSVVYLVTRRRGGACHKLNEHGDNRISCFFRRLVFSGHDLIIEY